MDILGPVMVVLDGTEHPTTCPRTFCCDPISYDFTVLPKMEYEILLKTPLSWWTGGNVGIEGTGRFRFFKEEERTKKVLACKICPRDKLEDHAWKFK